MEENTASTPDIAPLVSVRGLAVIAIHVSNLARSLEFYKKMLGFQEGEQMLEPGVTLQAGDATIYLAEGREPAEHEPGTRTGISLCLVAPGVRANYERLRDAGVRIVHEYTQASEFFATVGIADPDGNVVELWGRA
ncbi:MAG: VOC family protein [Bacteroidetes bacterium]|nr:VOC family protein [Bacteroidota bacterium]